jgi:energy-coupling factor transport system ATP-binding protein
MTLPLLQTEKLTHTYSPGTPFERVAIADINFTAEKGECIGIIGHTGSGKSTFIQHLNGLLKPTSGHVYYDGIDINETKDLKIRFKVGLVFQYPEYQLFESTVFDDIAFGPKNMGLSENEVKERVYEAAGFSRLSDEFLQKSPFELSGGQKRRAAIAGVIAMMPEVLILDEPAAGLDPGGRTEIIENILAYKEAANATLIMVTHSMEDIANTVDRVILFEDGGIAMDGAPKDVFSQGKRLTEMGLAAPKATMVADRLRNLGIPLDNDIYTISQLRAALNTLKN